MLRWIVILVLGAGLIVGLGVASARRDDDDFSVNWRIKKKVPPKEVQVERPLRRSIIQTVSAPGTVELVEEADIASEIVAKVVEVMVEKGDEVEAGQVLVRLDDTDAQARLESTEARILRLEAAIQVAEADLDKAIRDSENFDALSDRGFSTRSEVEDGRTAVAKMEATLEMGRQDLREMNATRQNALQDLDRTVIKAPIQGTVIDLDVEVGEVVIAGTTNLPGTVLMTIGDMSRMRVRADVDESDVVLVEPDQVARIYLQADQSEPIPGEVDLIAPKGTKVTEVVTFETLVDVRGSHPGLRPEMTATVVVEVKSTDDALSVPIQAVVHRRGKDLPDTPEIQAWLDRQVQIPGDAQQDDDQRHVRIVFVMEDGVAVARPVETGISDEQYIEILDGVDENDEVIVGPFRALDELQHDQPVKLEEPETTEDEATEPSAEGSQPGGEPTTGD